MGLGNMIDKAVLAVAPTRALKRVNARARVAAVMNYDAASRGRRSFGWKSPNTDADAAAQGGRAQLRNIARDMIRNRELAARAQMVITNNVVGTGITPSLVMEAGEDKEELQRILNEHLMSTKIDALGVSDLRAKQRVVMNTVVADGEILVRRRWRKPPFDLGLELPFQVELLEADYLDTTKLNNGKNEVVEGIEYSPFGRIVAYWIYVQHPGTASRLRQLKSVRVPAEDIIHVRRQDRPGQQRGVTWLAPVLMKMGEISDYQEGEIIKQKIAALMAVIVEKPEGAPMADGEDSSELGELEPGAIISTAQGEKVTITQPPQLNSYEAFMREGKSTIAMGLGISLEAYSGDLRGVNFASGRMGRMEMDRNVETWQLQIMINQFCRGIERWIGDGLEAIGKKYKYEMNWTAPRRALVDPVKEVPALAKKVESGLSSWQRVLREMGQDPETIRREIKEDQEADKAIGINKEIEE